MCFHIWSRKIVCECLSLAPYCFDFRQCTLVPFQFSISFFFFCFHLIVCFNSYTKYVFVTCCLNSGICQKKIVLFQLSLGSFSVSQSTYYLCDAILGVGWWNECHSLTLSHPHVCVCAHARQFMIHFDCEMILGYQMEKTRPEIHFHCNAFYYFFDCAVGFMHIWDQPYRPYFCK